MILLAPVELIGMEQLLLNLSLFNLKIRDVLHVQQAVPLAPQSLIAARALQVLI